MPTWLTWERTGTPPLRVEVPDAIADAVERHASELEADAATVIAALVAGLTQEVADPPDGEARAAAVRELLARGPVLVTIRTGAHGLDIPASLQVSACVSLRFGYGLVPPIVDLEIDVAGIRGSLVFGGVPHYCVLPWRAVLVAALENPPPLSPPARPARPKLKLV